MKKKPYAEKGCGGGRQSIQSAFVADPVKSRMKDLIKRGRLGALIIRTGKSAEFDAYSDALYNAMQNALEAAVNESAVMR